MPTLIYPACVHAAVRSTTRRVLSLDGDWTLRPDPEGRGESDEWMHSEDPFELSIPVPGCVNAVPELAADYPSHTFPNAYEGPCWYRHVFELPDDWEAPLTWLQFGGIMPSAEIWLNGRHLGSYSLSPVAFKVDATDALRAGTNVLTVELPWRDEGLRGGLCFGPGLWRTVELEATDRVHIENLFIRPQPGEALVTVTADIVNDSPSAQRIELCPTVTPWRDGTDAIEGRSSPVDVPAGGRASCELTVAMPGAHCWTPDDPYLYVLTLEARADGTPRDSLCERFGMREIAVGDDCLLLNGEPLMFRAVCDEFFGCPTIAPIVDRDLIRRRLELLKSLGFNAKRYHTHVPPREELELCDELGLLVHAEISVISNFHVTQPYPACREVWKAALQQIRNHASLATYCMGNEGAQIMDGKYERVREYDADARALAPDTPILAASGMQGEHPEVPNDYETPHFWARFFKWSYDGLTATPTAFLAPLADKGPLVIHEYGKFTVWPDPAEDEYFREAGMPLRAKYGAMGRIALEEAGLQDLLPRLLPNSRALAAVCHKTSIEDIRRLPKVTGYHVLSAFRLNGNRGMADELARHVDEQFDDFADINAPTALVLDRGFQGRTLLTSQEVRLTVHISHFGAEDLSDGVLHWELKDADGQTLASDRASGLSMQKGRNAPLTDLTFRTPDTTGRLELVARLDEADGPCFARNRWPLWTFQAPDAHGIPPILSDMARRESDLDLMAMFFALRRLDDAVSLRRGDRICKTPSDQDAAEYLAATPPPLLVSDRWTDAAAAYAAGGGTILLLNTGHFPEAWYAPREKTDKAYGADIEYDLFTMFTPFRAGWDHGNAATVIEDDALLEGFPHEGFCDLQCFAMVQGARSLRTAELPGSVQPVIRVVPVWRRKGAQAGPSPTDPDTPRAYQTDDRVYLADCAVGKGRVVVSSLRFFADPAGRWLLERLVRRLSA